MEQADFDGFSEDDVSDELRAAWKADPRCLECGETVLSVLEAALLVGPNRVTHRERCFIPALVRGNPHLKLLTTRDRAKEDTTAVPPKRNADERRTAGSPAPAPEPGDG